MRALKGPKGSFEAFAQRWLLPLRAASMALQAPKVPKCAKHIEKFCWPLQNAPKGHEGSPMGYQGPQGIFRGFTEGPHKPSMLSSASFCARRRKH